MVPVEALPLPAMIILDQLRDNILMSYPKGGKGKSKRGLRRDISRRKSGRGIKENIQWESLLRKI